LLVATVQAGAHQIQMMREHVTPCILVICDKHNYSYCIAQNFGGRKHLWIWWMPLNPPMFFPPITSTIEIIII